MMVKRVTEKMWVSDGDEKCDGNGKVMKGKVGDSEGNGNWVGNSDGEGNGDEKNN